MMKMIWICLLLTLFMVTGCVSYPEEICHDQVWNIRGNKQSPVGYAKVKEVNDEYVQYVNIDGTIIFTTIEDFRENRVLVE